MDASESLLVLTTFQNIAVVALLLRILNHMDVLRVLSIPTHVSKAMAKSGAKSLEDGRQEKAFSGVEGLWIHIDEIMLGRGHVPSY